MQKAQNHQARNEPVMYFINKQSIRVAKTPNFFFKIILSLCHFDLREKSFSIATD